MRHPFDGIIQPASPTRRSWVKGLFAGVVGLFVARTASAVAPPSGKVRVVAPTEPNSEPGDPKKPVTTTKALREEGAGVGKPTTLALREEGGRVTTLAVGEEGGVKPAPPPPPPMATTLAIGEEG